MKEIREWRNNEWEHGPKGVSQNELQRMARKIILNADDFKSEWTPGMNEFGRVYTVKSKLCPDVKFIIHMEGTTIEDIIEIVTK